MQKLAAQAFSILVFLIAIEPRAFAQGQKWCGTDSQSFFGFLSTLIPERFPQSGPNSSCPERRAQIWKACRAHDECYWDLGKPVSRCQSDFLRNFRRECQKAFANVPKRMRRRCEPLNDECHLTANVYHSLMLKAEYLTGSSKEARSEALAVFRSVSSRVGKVVIRNNIAFIHNRISYYCPRFKDSSNICRTSFVAGKVIRDLHTR